MEVETEGGEQQGSASQSPVAIDEDTQTDLAASDIDGLCQQQHHSQEFSAKLQYNVFVVDSAVADGSRLSFYTGLPGHLVDAVAE